MRTYAQSVGGEKGTLLCACKGQINDILEGFIDEYLTRLISGVTAPGNSMLGH